MEIVRANQRTLQESPIPKLLLYAEPGAVIGSAEVEWCQEHAANLATVNLESGTHFLPEDQPTEIAAALRTWLLELDQTT